jgi:hypothetical protein
VLKPARGLFLHAKFHDSAAVEIPPIESPTAENVKEEKFYEPSRSECRARRAKTRRA